ncbi:VOC family protein [Actinomadura bangladeshensis]|uniref:VOC family protein n=1 Tax=Actinomadura bangladeshensis TaxID=453573 RepID=UPI0030B825A7
MIHSLGYLRFETPEAGAWRDFGTGVLGLAAAEGPRSDAVYLRMDEHAARLVFLPGDTERLLAAGWELPSGRALEEAARRLEAAGHPVKEGTAEEAADRRVERLVHVDDPNGNRLELYHGPALDHAPLVTPFGNRFVAGDLGLGHVVLPAPDVEASFDFYTALLGFRHRDSMRLPAALAGGKPEDDPVWMRFLGCNPRHHSLALFPGEVPGGIVHFMLELETLDDVGRGLDRFLEREIAIQSTLGRHTNDKMVSFYAATPGTGAVEYGTDAVLVDDATWSVKEITADAYWGHRWGG